MYDLPKDDPQAEPPDEGHVTAPIECPKCGTDRVLGDLDVSRTGSLIQPIVYVVPRDKGLFDSRASRLTAVCCPSCGFTELYANAPKQMMPKDNSREK